MAARTETAIDMPPADGFLLGLPQDLDTSSQPMFVELLLCGKNCKGEASWNCIVCGTLFVFQKAFSPIRGLAESLRTNLALHNSDGVLMDSTLRVGKWCHKLDQVQSCLPSQMYIFKSFTNFSPSTEYVCGETRDGAINNAVVFHKSLHYTCHLKMKGTFLCDIQNKLLQTNKTPGQLMPSAGCLQAIFILYSFSPGFLFLFRIQILYFNKTYKASNCQKALGITWNSQ